MVNLAVADARKLQAYLMGLDDLLRRRTARAFDLAVLSHTHSAEAPVRITLPGRRAIWAANSGAWQRVIPAKDVTEYRRAHGMPTRDVLRRIRLEDLPACYPFVVAEPYHGHPTARLSYWTPTGEAEHCAVGIAAQ
jgi:hypothetical protein